MNRLNYSIRIDAPAEKVWHTMLDPDIWRRWTEPFATGSHFVGDWNTGSEIRFLAPGKSGKMSGTISRIQENRPFEYISIEHIGVVDEGKDDLSGEVVQEWQGAHENYIFRDMGGQTEVLVEMDSNDKYKDMFEEMWPKALQKLKELTEAK